MLSSWQAPSMGLFKINADGVIERNQVLRSCGGILKNESGSFLGGFALIIGKCSIVEARLWIIYHGLKLT